ncbi:MAG TPA: TlpA family protein disulfide reductase [Epsilonproteobacteria bacterium]|nr:TlpA family protein disulfide reductase [Campylobacterota bacterium]
MHIIGVFFLTLLFLLTGCEEKQSSSDIPVENTTEFLRDSHEDTAEENRFKIHHKVITQRNKTLNKNPMKKKKPVSFSDTFMLQDIKQTTYTVTVSNTSVVFKEAKQDIVLVNFFASWCPPCLYQIPYYNDLEKKYAKEVLLVGVLIHDNITTPKFKSFLAKESVKYYIARSHQNNDFASLVAKTLHLPTKFSIPLTVMYVKGKYFTHYESIVPIEMIEYDIQQAQKKLKQ